VAIALDGGVPEYGADATAGVQPRPGIFRRDRDAAPAANAPQAGETAREPRGGRRARGRGGAHRAVRDRRPPAPQAARDTPAGQAPAIASPALPGPAFRGPALPGPVLPGLARAAEAARPGTPDQSAPGRDGRDRGTRRPMSIRGLAIQRVARTESMAVPEPAADAPPAPAGFDARAVKESFAYLMANAPLAMEHFYAHLFTASPETRAMFPLDMTQMREHLFAALSRLVWILDSPAESAAYLSQLGREHRKYGVKEQHFAAFFGALLETAAYFSGSDWTEEIEAAWHGALEYAARTMRTAADADARDYPAWWVGEIVAHDRRTESVAVLTIRPDKPLPYRAGQYVPVQVPRWPRVWRPYSIANAPRADGLISLHVRAVPGGMVSADLVRHAVAGDTVLLGPAAGDMVAPDGDRDLTCVAGGTGLAPIKAIAEAAAGRRPGGRDRRDRRVTLFVGARRMPDLYDLPDLQAMQSAYPGLQVVVVLSEDSVLSPQPLLSDQQAAAGLTAMTGMLPGAVAGFAGLAESDVYICGPAAMVRRTTLLLAGHVPADRVHHDPLPADPARAAWLIQAQARQAQPGDAGDFRQSPLFAKFARPGFEPATGF
jgi:NAD(P)H-flavin reductase/hemoglobin-like flavoprotein